MKELCCSIWVLSILSKNFLLRESDIELLQTNGVVITYSHLTVRERWKAYMFICLLRL